MHARLKCTDTWGVHADGRTGIKRETVLFACFRFNCFLFNSRFLLPSMFAFNVLSNCNAFREMNGFLARLLVRNLWKQSTDALLFLFVGWIFSVKGLKRQMKNSFWRRHSFFRLFFYSALRGDIMNASYNRQGKILFKQRYKISNAEKKSDFLKAFEWNLVN